MFLLILLSGYLIRLFCAFNTTISRDGIKYLNLANEWNRTSVIPTDCRDTFFFIYLLKTILLFNCDPIVSGLALNIVLGTVLLFLIYVLSFSYSKSLSISLLVTLLATFHPTLILFSSDILRENLFIICAILSVFFFTKKTSRNKYLLNLLLSGGVASFAVLCRLEGLFLIIYFFIFLLLSLYSLQDKILFIFVYNLAFIICYILVYCTFKSFDLASLFDRFLRYLT